MYVEWQKSESYIIIVDVLSERWSKGVVQVDMAKLIIYAQIHLATADKLSINRAIIQESIKKYLHVDEF